MSDPKDDFFEGKRPWSIIKDEVLSSYMPSYLAKVKQLRRPIILVDGFAGPGLFDDGSEGSPLIMCKAAEKNAAGNYRAYFINKEKKYHDRLVGVLRSNSQFNAATPILGDTTEILPLLPNMLHDQTVFLYLDPFGPTGSPFGLLEPFLARRKQLSTEIVLMMHMPIAHRLASRNAVEEGKGNNPTIQKFHQTMTQVFGGDYWKPIMLSPGFTAEEREKRLINAYCNKLATYLPFAGSCPVQEGKNDPVKYFIVFASRHPDAMLLMNDAMFKAYHKRMHEDEYGGTLYENSDWKELLSTRGLQEVVIEEVKSQPGIKREDLWLKIVRNHFMIYQRSEFIKTVQRLVDDRVLNSPTERKTKQLNNDCVLFLS